MVKIFKFFEERNKTFSSFTSSTVSIVLFSSSTICIVLVQLLFYLFPGSYEDLDDGVGAVWCISTVALILPGDTVCGLGACAGPQFTSNCRLCFLLLGERKSSQAQYKQYKNFFF